MLSERQVDVANLNLDLGVLVEESPGQACRRALLDELMAQVANLGRECLVDGLEPEGFIFCLGCKIGTNALMECCDLFQPVRESPRVWWRLSNQ